MIRTLLLFALACKTWAQDEVVELTAWRMQQGDDVHWAVPDLDDSGWQNNAPPSLRLLEPNLGGVHWYRSSIELPQPLQSRPLAIGVGPLEEVYDVYVEGTRIGGFGQWLPKPSSPFNRHLSFPIPPNLTNRTTLHLAIRRWNSKSGTNWVNLPSGIPHAPRIGPAALVAALEQGHNWESTLRLLPSKLMNGVLFLVGLGILALFTISRHWEYLWLSLRSITGGGAYLAGWAIVAYAPARHAILPTLAVSLLFLSEFFTMLFLGSLCPRWKKHIWVALGIPLLVLYWHAADFLYGTSTAPSISFVLMSQLAVQAAVALHLLTDRQRENTGLGIALLLTPLGRAVAEFVPAYRRMSIGEFSVDGRDLANLLIAVFTLVVLYRRFSRQQQRQALLEEDMNAASRVQQLLLDGPATQSPGFAIDAVYQPAREVGGDFYQMIPGGDGSMLVVFGDVSGKGLEAAMVVATLLGALRTITTRQPVPVLEHLNRALSTTGRAGFVTCCCALFHPDGLVSLANAGNPAPYQAGLELDTGAGLPLGVVAEGCWDEIQFTSQSSITFVSDGVIEAANGRGELFGFERTAAISIRAANEIAAAAQAWGQNDDITVVTVRSTR